MVNTRFVSPKDFRVGEAWIVFRVNRWPFRMEDGLYDSYILMDVGSTYIFGQVFVPEGGRPVGTDVEELLQDARRKQIRWARRLIVTKEGPTESVFIEKAKDYGLRVEKFPPNVFQPIVGEIRTFFEQTIFKKQG